MIRMIRMIGSHLRGTTERKGSPGSPGTTGTTSMPGMTGILTGVMIVFTLATLVPALMPTSVHAQSGLTGKWQGETPGGSQIVLDLTATDTTVKGTLTRNGEDLTISDGKVTKNKFTFTVLLEGNTEGITGELNEEKVTVWPDRQGPSRAAVLTRVKK